METVPLNQPPNPTQILGQLEGPSVNYSFKASKSLIPTVIPIIIPNYSKSRMELSPFSLPVEGSVHSLVPDRNAVTGRPGHRPSFSKVRKLPSTCDF